LRWSLNIYIVQPGDSIWTISRRFGVSPDIIISANGLQNTNVLVAGQSLVIPGKPENYGYLQTNAFIEPRTPERDTKLVNETAAYLTYITPFSHHVTAEAGLTPLDDAAVINAARDYRTAPMASVSNISESGNFDTALIDKILNDAKLQQTLINNIITLLNSKGYYGVIVDFERITPANRNKYNDFLRKLTAALHNSNKIAATALAPKTYDVLEGAWHGAHDYKAHGEIADFVVIMTYEWGYSGGPPMAVAPLSEVRKVINFAVSVIPPKKIMMGIPLYGYDWTLPYTPGGQFAEAVGNQEAVTRAAKVGAFIRYDHTAQSPYYSYWDAKGQQHIVWFEDARSIEAKLKLASQYGLRGVSCWVLAKPFPQNWQVLNSMFRIEKII
jgi:spore germination protein